MNNTENIIIRKYEKDDLPETDPHLESGCGGRSGISAGRVSAQLGTIPGGFRMKDGTFEDICPYYHVL